MNAIRGRGGRGKGCGVKKNLIPITTNVLQQEKK